MPRPTLPAFPAAALAGPVRQGDDNSPYTRPNTHPNLNTRRNHVIWPTVLLVRSVRAL